MIQLTLGLMFLFLLLWVAFAIGTQHGRKLERDDQLNRLKKMWDELDMSFSDADTLDDITVPVRFTGYRDHTIN